jgi:hypothetical protein
MWRAPVGHATVASVLLEPLSGGGEPSKASGEGPSDRGART